MRTRTGMAVLAGALLVVLSHVHAAEYFVTKQGNDANNGSSRQTAFLTIQKGVDALKAGDTLTIGPGEYFENVKRDTLGNADVDTIIRAEVPGAVLLRGDIDAPEFEKVEGYRFVYAVSFDQTPLAVLEHGTSRVLEERPNSRDVEYEPGTFYYNTAAKKLYVSSTDLRAPGHRRYSIAVNGKTGIELTKPQRVLIEGLAAGGFYPGWGIMLNEPVSCTVRDCITFMNQGGVCADSGSDNIIESCESYGNTFGGIVRYRANNDVIRNCRTYKNIREGREHFGIMHYFNMSGPLVFKNNVSWGHNFDYSIKPNVDQPGRVENCVALGHIRNSHLFHNLLGDGNESDPNCKASADNILFWREEELDKDFEFADHLNLDFRLQPDSRFRGTATDGSDCGPCPYEANIFYVAPGGDDEADGLSMRAPWRTLKHALGRVRPGDTLYLAQGKYAAVHWTNAGDARSPIAIRGRGRGTAVIAGTLKLTGCAGVAFERLNFSGGVLLNDNLDLAFRNCTFYGAPDGLKAEKTGGLSVRHCVFVRAPLRLEESDRITLAGNIYSTGTNPGVTLGANVSIRYSDYNGYRNAARCWEVNGARWSLAELRKRHDRYSRTLNRETSRASTKVDFGRWGPHSKTLGIHHEYQAKPEELALVGPFVHSVSDTTANIEWWTSRPATFELCWGETPAMENVVENLKAPDCFTTYSLTGLKPDTDYYFRIRSADTSDREDDISATVLKPEGEPLSFTTMAVAPEPAVYYVAPDGDDANTGLSREQAWRTVSHAADMVNVGDTVMIAGGNYSEDVRIRATGDEERPITFRCIPGERAVFHGNNLIQAFKIVVKKHIHFDGFYFEDFGSSMDALFALWHADDVRITRCFNVKGALNIAFLSADYSANLLVKNCVTASGFSCLRLHVSPDWRIENNLLLRPLIMALYFVNEPEQKGFFSKNIVTDNLAKKVIIPLVDVGRFRSFVERDNCYFLRAPDEERKMLRFFGTAAYERYVPSYGVTTDYKDPPVFVDNPDGTENNPRFSLKEYQAMVGDTGSYVGDPKFAGTANMEPGGKLWTGHPATMFDKLLGKKGLDFPDTFATDPKAVEKGIGPQPDAFEDFWFNKEK